MTYSNTTVKISHMNGHCKPTIFQHMNGICFLFVSLSSNLDLSFFLYEPSPHEHDFTLYTNHSSSARNNEHTF